MFIGHYAPAILLAAPNSQGQRPIKLWQAFLAVQIIDFIWAIFILLGIENMRGNPVEFYNMPYTHSVVFTFFWAVLAVLVFKKLSNKKTWSTSFIFGGLVMSHWFADFLVHVPDLTLWPGSQKYGLGLGARSNWGLILEISLLLLVSAIYILKLKSLRFKTVTAFLSLISIMLGLQFTAHFFAVPQTPNAFVIQLTGIFLLLISLAAYFERAALRS